MVKFVIGEFLDPYEYYPSYTGLPSHSSPRKLSSHIKEKEKKNKTTREKPNDYN